jgi:PRTRC genetic system protein E
MFTELVPLLKKGDTLVITVSKESDTEIRVNVIPKLFTLDGEHGEDRIALNQPITVTGSAAELDGAEFVATLTRFTTSTAGLRQTIDNVEAAHKHAAESKLNPKPAPAARHPSRPATKSAAALNAPGEPEVAAAPQEVAEAPADPKAEPETEVLGI